MKIISNLIEAHVVYLGNHIVNYLLLKRSPIQKYPNIWQMVTGKIEKGEQAFETALREIKEETSLNIEKLYVVPKVNSFYNSDDDTINLIPVFVAVVNKKIDVHLSHEHQEYKWTNKKEACNLLAWPGQSESVKIIHKFFKKNNSNLNFVEIKFK